MKFVDVVFISANHMSCNFFNVVIRAEKYNIFISEEIIETVHDLQALDASQVCHWNNCPSVIVNELLLIVTTLSKLCP